MPTDKETTSVPRRTRPKDRKRQILALARDLFLTRGYHAVTMNLIAEHAGITAGALYRHFAGKPEILNAVLTEAVDATTGTRTAGSFEDLLELRTSGVVEHQYLGVLWAREAKNLKPEDREALVERLRGHNAEIAGLIESERPELDHRDALTLGWAIQSIFASPGHYPSTGGKTEAVEAIRAACRRVCALSLPVTEAVARPVSELRVASQREAILSAAFQLFGERGYQSTSLADVGALAGGAGSNVYNYFDGKPELLSVVYERGVWLLWSALHTALRLHADPESALTDLVRRYVTFATQYPYLTAIQGMDDSPQVIEQRARQQEFVREWVVLMRAARPELTDDGAQVLVQAALVTVNDLSRTRGVAGRPGVVPTLTALACAILDLDPRRACEAP